MIPVFGPQPDAGSIVQPRPALLRLSRFLSTENLPLQDVLHDPTNHLMDRLNAVGIPTTMVFDADGTLVRAHTGEISRAALRTLIGTAKER